MRSFFTACCILALLLCMTGCTIFPSIPTSSSITTAGSTTITENTATTVTTTTAATTTTTTVPTTAANGIVYRTVEPYSLAVGNPEKKLFDAPCGNYIGVFGNVGYYTAVKEAVDINDFIWCQLADGRWTYVYQEALPALDMLFASGAGAWGTELTLKGDGSFSGNYHDSNMGETGPDHPHGTCYTCSFSGNLHIANITPNAVTLKLANISTSNTVGDQWISDNILYIAAEPYGMTDAEYFTLYLPSTPVNELPSDTFMWGSGRIPASGSLGCYALYNTQTGDTFFSN